MIKICIADDEEYVLKSIRRRIEQSGLDVEIAGTAKNGVEAYELYEKVNPDIYYVDINMPLCSGLDFVERVRTLDKNSITKFIIVSGYDDFAYMKKAIKTGVVNYIMKPISQQEFMDTLREACEDIEALREKQIEEYGRQWEFFQDYMERREKFSGTALLFYGEDALAGIREAAEGLREILHEKISHDSWDHIRFHGSEHLAMLLGSDVWLNEKQICALWEETGKYQEVYLAYKTGRDMKVTDMANTLEYAMLGRFFPGALHIMEADRPADRGGEMNLEVLDRAIENTREEKWEEEVESAFDEIFAHRDNRGLLKSFYHSVLILTANKYTQHNFEIPEKLKTELYPFSLMNCADQEEIRHKVKGYIRMIHEKIAGESEKDGLVQQVIRFLETHYTEDISLTDVANEFFVVPNYLAKKFKEKKNMTAMQYLENFRMEKAADYLRNTEQSVTEIAGKVGYNDANYFTRTFRKRYGISPREYRNRQRVDLC